MDTGYFRLYRHVVLDPRWQVLGDAAKAVFIEYLCLAEWRDGPLRGVICSEPGKPLSQVQRGLCIGKSRQALWAIEHALVDAGFITVQPTGSGRLTAVSIAQWCLDERQAQPNAPASSQGRYLPSDKAGPSVNVPSDKAGTCLATRQVRAKKPKGPLPSSGAEEGRQERTSKGGGEGRNPAASEPSQEPSAGHGAPPEIAHSNGNGASVVADNGQRRTATAALSETKDGNDEIIRRAVSFATGENMHTNESRQRVEDFVAEMRGAMTSGLTLEELLDALTALPPTGEHRWGRTWMPVAREHCILERQRRQQQLQSSIIAELLAAGSLEAQWQIATRLWDEHENLRPRLEPPPPGMPEAAAIWLPAAEWEPIARATGFHAITKEQLHRAIAQRDGTETEEQRAQRERLRAMVDALRDGRPIPVSEPAQQAVEVGSRSREA